MNECANCGTQKITARGLCNRCYCADRRDRLNKGHYTPEPQHPEISEAQHAANVAGRDRFIAARRARNVPPFGTPMIGEERDYIKETRQYVRDQRQEGIAA